MSPDHCGAWGRRGPCGGGVVPPGERPRTHHRRQRCAVWHGHAQHTATDSQGAKPLATATEFVTDAGIDPCADPRLSSPSWKGRSACCPKRRGEMGATGQAARGEAGEDLGRKARPSGAHGPDPRPIDRPIDTAAPGRPAASAMGGRRRGARAAPAVAPASPEAALQDAPPLGGGLGRAHRRARGVGRRGGWGSRRFPPLGSAHPGPDAARRASTSDRRRASAGVWPARAREERPVRGLQRGTRPQAMGPLVGSPAGMGSLPEGRSTCDSPTPACPPNG